MPDDNQMKILMKGVQAWNEWRSSNPEIRPDLNEADLRRRNLSGANLADSNLHKADLCYSTLAGAILCGADLRYANFIEVDLRGADLTSADLCKARLIHTKLENTTLKNCRVFGISTWDVTTNDNTKQSDLIISHDDESRITVENIEVAQFIYMLLNNKKVRDVIETIGEKGVLILGRFIPAERKALLDAIRDRLQTRGFVPMMFDFERPTQRDFTETIKTLAGLSRFIIADISNPRSSPLELQAIMPDYMVPFVPIIQDNEEPFAMFRDLKQKYGEWVLDVLKYDSVDNLIKVLDEAVVRPALEKGQKLLLKKAEEINTRHVHDFM